MTQKVCKQKVADGIIVSGQDKNILMNRLVYVPDWIYGSSSLENLPLGFGFAQSPYDRY
jgi:hypothetical protein